MTVTQIQKIHQEIEELSERRTELWHALSRGHDPALSVELKALSQRLDTLWDEERTLKAALRFGDREHIVARARVEERLERAA
jgi:predicted  nucleic acid-binding Zn-ribbon protein